MYDDNGAPIRRRTHLTDEAEELRYLALELEADHDAYVSRGRAPWRGLSGHDPLDDVPDEEFGERQWENWHDAALDEDERPRRRRPSGREVDIVPPVVAPVTVRVDPAIAAAFAERQEQATEGPTWVVDGGRVTVVGDFKVWSGPCIECAQEFTQRRPASQRRKWRRLCGGECSTERRRTANRERMRAVRADEDAA
ncbi:hypothetical protein [Streptomyces purpurascens]|uniref:hypothetical protein n=1 Tax=Streptomyces purpurascens TaxID=1924 RepID=UPI00167A60A6|nr:hypothetical protein [Streptomyces purpurascens]MCE7050642.1 hypothetical protein [Streptomyces purpurascens]GHA35544.1 hypothetical protein GCM10010303_52880 [Streptomyces purpurascens]